MSLKFRRDRCEVCAAIEKTCYILHANFRNFGDFDGIPINLQVLEQIMGSLIKI